MGRRTPSRAVSCALLAAAVLMTMAASKSDATIALTTQPGSALEATAMRLVAQDLKEARQSGDEPLLLVGSARLSTAPGSSALLVQVQSASFCGSAGCSTSIYVKHGKNWKKVLDSISGPIKVSQTSHKGMRDLLVHGKDRWVWTGSAYADTLPTPNVDLKDSKKE